MPHFLSRGNVDPNEFYFQWMTVWLNQDWGDMELRGNHDVIYMSGKLEYIYDEEVRKGIRQSIYPNVQLPDC